MNNGNNHEPSLLKLHEAIDRSTFEITGAITELQKSLETHFAELQNTLRAIEQNTHKEKGPISD